MDRSQYVQELDIAFNNGYIDYLGSKTERVDFAPNFPCKAVVYIRRGDVQVCDYNKFSHRYLPNSYFFEAIQHYAEAYYNEKDICIFSETKSSESWQLFSSYSIHLDKDPTIVWSTMLQAELIILSKSSFSLVPAIMNERAKVIYVPFLHGKLSKWETVSDEMINAAQDNVKALLTSCPKLEWENNCTQETHCFLFNPTQFFSTLPIKHRIAGYRQLYGSSDRHFHSNWARCRTDKIDWTYIHARKAGWNTMYEVVRKYCQNPEIFGSIDASRAFRNDGEEKFIRHLKDLLKDSFLFSFVRNPIPRFLSAMGQVARAKPNDLNIVGCLSGNATQDLKCVISRLKDGVVVNQHFLPASVELLQMTFPVEDAKVALMPLWKMDDVIDRLGLLNAITKQNVGRKHFSLHMLDRQMIDDLCYIYDMDVRLLKKMNISTSECIEEQSREFGRGLNLFSVAEKKPPPPSYSKESFKGCTILKPNDFIYEYGPWDGAPIVIESYKLVFFTTPKVASTEFKKFFRQIIGHPDFQMDGHPLPHAPTRNGLTYLYDYPPRLADRIMTDPSWTRAIFVREPKERLLSAFLDKGRKNHYIQRHCCPREDKEDVVLFTLLDCGNIRKHYGPLTKNEDEAILSLADFAEHVYHECSDPHWNPQNERVETKYWRLMNFVGKFSNLSVDLEKLLYKINASEVVKQSWRRSSVFKSVSYHATNSSSRLTLMTPDIISKFGGKLKEETEFIDNMASVDDPSCSCLVVDDINCCERIVLRAHKMGVRMIKKLFVWPHGIRSEIIQPDLLSNRPEESDYRHVVVTRSWYDSIVSGYLYHKSGRECWLDQDGLPRLKNKTFEWESKLKYPISGGSNRTLCEFLVQEPEEVGVRAYVDYSISHLYQGILPYHELATNMTDGAKKSLFLCYDGFASPDTQQKFTETAFDWLYPGGHTFPLPPKTSKVYSGGHSTGKNNDERLRLKSLVARFDDELFEGRALFADNVLGCQSTEEQNENKQFDASTSLGLLREKQNPNSVGWIGKAGLKSFMMQFFDERNTVCDIPNSVAMLNVSFGCREIYETMNLGSGNLLVGFYAMRLAALSRGNLSISISCPDASDEMSSLVLPWITGFYPSSLQSKQKIPEHKNMCSSIDHSPIGLMHKEIQYDLRRMAIALVGIPNRTFTSSKVSAWINDVRKHDKNKFEGLIIPGVNGARPFYEQVELDDVVIHFRCGDLMSSGHSQFGFLRFQSYIRHISLSARSVGIVTQPFDATSTNLNRRWDRKAVTRERCGVVVNDFRRYVMENMPTMKVSIHSNESISLSFARMIMANQTIVAISTFGVFPAIASFGTGYIRRPDLGQRTDAATKMSAVNQWLLQQPRVDRQGELELYSEPDILMVREAKRLWEEGGAEKILSWFRFREISQIETPHEKLNKLAFFYGSSNEFHYVDWNILNRKWVKSTTYSEIQEMSQETEPVILSDTDQFLSARKLMLWHAVPKTGGTTTRKAIFNHINTTCPSAGHAGTQAGAFSHVSDLSDLVSGCTDTTYFGLGGRQKFVREQHLPGLPRTKIYHLVAFREFQSYAESAINQIVKANGIEHCPLILSRLINHCQTTAELSFEQYSKNIIKHLMDGNPDDVIILYNFEDTDLFFRELAKQLSVQELPFGVDRLNTEHSNETCNSNVLNHFLFCFEDKL